VRARRRVLTAAIALLAGAAVALPTAALSETSPTIEAVNEGGGGYYGETHRWSPSSATVSSGGTVTFSNPTNVEHGLRWLSETVPACSKTVPVGSFGTKWMGTCTFSQPGVYDFVCTVHPSMTGTITVQANGTTTVTSTNTNPTPTGTTSSPQPQGTTGGGGGPAAPAGSSTPSLAGSRLLGVSATSAGTVTTTLRLPASGAGASVEVDVLTARASLAAGTAGARRGLALVAQLRRTNLHAGRLALVVRLNAKARRALHRHHRLVLVVHVLLKAPASAAHPTLLSRSVVAHG
jgi:plastocyanin